MASTHPGKQKTNGASPRAEGVPPPDGPIRTNRLSQEQGQADSTRIGRSPWSTFEPDNTVAGTLQMQHDARQGYPDALMELSHRILERDLHVRSVCQTRTRALDRVPVHVEAFSKSPADQLVAEAVQRDIVDRADFRRLRRELSWAFWTGYEIAEMVWDTSDPQAFIPNFKWRHHQFFAWDRQAGEELRIKTEAEPVHGEELEPYKWICHAPSYKNGGAYRQGLVMPVSSYHLLKSHEIRYWISLAEVHGMPWRVGRIQGQEPNETDRLKMLQALIDLGHDAAVLLPKNLELEVKDALTAGGAADFHERFARFLNQEISKGVLGQTMTSEDGSSRAQAEVHDKVRDDIRDADLADLDEFRDQIAAAYVAINFGPDVPVPYMTSVTKKPEDAANVAKAVQSMSTAAGRPVPIALADAVERIGFRVPEQGEVLLNGQIMGAEGPEGEDPSVEEEEPDTTDDQVEPEDDEPADED